MLPTHVPHTGSFGVAKPLQALREEPCEREEPREETQTVLTADALLLARLRETFTTAVRSRPYLSCTAHCVI